MADSAVTLIGSLGRDPELAFTPGGHPKCTFSIAVSRRFKRGDEWEEKTAWVDITAWGTLGENAAASFAKGTRVIVIGYIDQDEWEDKETGKKRTKLHVIADNLGPDLRWARAEVERIERERA